MQHIGETGKVMTIGHSSNSVSVRYGNGRILMLNKDVITKV
jgi:hypothetical protein